MKNNSVLCGVAGRSGGHILPCLTFINNRIKEKNIPQKKILFFTTSHTLDTNIIHTTEHTVTPVALPLINIPYKKPWLFPYFFMQAICATLKAGYYLYKHKVTEIISTGGYIALPVCFAGKILGVAIRLFELNVEPGKASKVLAPYCSAIHICFEQTKKFLPKITCTFTDYPLRFSSQKSFHPIKANKTILILGGSQGSEFLNQLTHNFTDYLTKHNIALIHQTGNPKKAEYLDIFYKQNNITAEVFAFNTNLENYYKKSDLVICRAGAGTLFEVAFFKKPCIMIPLETPTNSHQVLNAQAFVQNNPHFKMIRQKDMSNSSELLIKHIQYFLDQPTQKVPADS